MGKYDIALKELPLDEGLTRIQIMGLLEKAGDTKVIPYEVQGEHSVAAGYITLTAAEKMDFLYTENSQTYRFVKQILDDMEKENERCEYEVKIKNHVFHIWLSR